MFDSMRSLVLVLGLVLAGCSGSGPQADFPVTVTGTIAEIDDRVPVDGGVTITLELDQGGTELLLFGSLFTYPPPDEERVALYQKIVEAEVGSHVKATGIREEDGIELTDFQILDR